jgi:ABC-2 type transport system ATP-binding protein
VVIGRGRLITDVTTREFVAASSLTTVVVRSPRIDDLVARLRERGATATAEADGAVTVTGIAREEIGDLAAAEGIALHELATRVATLEQAFLEATEGAEEFRSRPEGERR